MRDQQGVHSLEAVQEFFKIIKEPMQKATCHTKDLNAFLPTGKFILDIQAVIILVYEDNNGEAYHAVRVSKAKPKIDLGKSRVYNKVVPNFGNF